MQIVADQAFIADDDDENIVGSAIAKFLSFYVDPTFSLKNIKLRSSKNPNIFGRNFLYHSS